MATVQFTGRAAAVAQVTKIVFSSIVATNTYSVTVNGKTISAVATGTSLATLLDALIASWGASAEPEHRALVAAYHRDSGGTIDGLMLTAAKAGVPWTVTAAATTGLATVTQDTNASGPNFFNVDANWSTGSMPSAGDTLELIDCSVSILYGLVVTTNFAALKIYASYTGQIGLPAWNTDGYAEFRTRFLTLGDGTVPIAVTIGEGVGNHAPSIRYNANDAATTLVIFDGQSNSTNYPIEITDMKSTSTGVVYGGGVLIDDSTTGTLVSLKVMARSGSRTKPKVKTTSRMTVTATEVYGQGAEVELNGSGTTLVVRDNAKAITRSAAAIGTVTASGRGVISWQSSGGIGTKLNVQTDGDVDFSEQVEAKTIAACDIARGGRIRDPYKVVTWTTGVALQDGARLADVTLDLGPGVTVSV